MKLSRKLISRHDTNGSERMKKERANLRREKRGNVDTDFRGT